MLWSRLPSILLIVLIFLSPFGSSQLRQVALPNGRRPLRPYVYPVVVGGIRYFREYSRAQLRQQWGALTRQQLQNIGRELPRTSNLRKYASAMSSTEKWAGDYPTTEQKMKELYGERARVYDDDSFHLRQGADYMQYAQLKPGQNVLDLACGTGIVALFAKAAVGVYGRVTGVDISDSMLDKAREKAKMTEEDVEFLKHDVTNLTDLHLPGDWDLITCASAFIFLDDQVATLQHWATFLKPGGRIIFDVPTETFDTLNWVISDAASAIGISAFYDGRWAFDDTAVAMRLVKAGLDHQVFKSRTYASRTIDLEEGLRLLHRLLRGPLGRLLARSEGEMESLARLAEINLRTTFAQNMDANGLMTDEIQFYVAIGTKRSDR